MCNNISIEKKKDFVYDFSRKTFLILYSINWPNFIVWLSLHLEILGNMCIKTVYFPGCDVIDFDFNVILLIKLLFCMSEKSRQKYKYLEIERAIKMK